MRKTTVILFVLFSCFIFGQKKNKFKFKKGKYSVNIVLDNNENYLKLNTANQIKICSKNIRGIDLTPSGTNLKITKVNFNENTTYWTITPNKEDIEDGNYKLLISFRDKRSRLFQHKFAIPVKQI